MDNQEYLKQQRDLEWRAELRKQISAKDRSAMARISMPEQERG